MAFNGIKTQVWDRSTPNDGVSLDVEFSRLYENDNALNAKDSDLQQQISALAGGINIVPNEIKHCTNLDVSTWTGLTHTMDLGQSATFAEGDLVVSSFDMNIYTAHATAWILLKAVADRDAFFIVDDKIYFNTTPEGVVDLLYNNAGVIVTLFDMPAITPQLIGAAPASAVPAGVMFDFTGLSAPIGFILASGRTIGDVGSGATERANADTFDLFSLYWGYADTALPLQDSSGVTIARSTYADAAAAFAANARMTIPDLRGRVTIGLDNMGGAAAGRITLAGCGIDGNTSLATGGAQTHTLAVTEMPVHTHTQLSHTHTASTTSAGAHSHISGPSDPGGGTWGSRYGVVNTGIAMNYVGGNVYSNTWSVYTNSSGGHTHTVSVDGSVATNQNTGGGAAHNNVQPAMVFPKIIKL